jgi:hypothetical protein
MNQSQKNDPRAWGKAAMAGATGEPRSQDELQVIAVNTAISRGATLGKDARTHRWVSLRRKRAELIHHVGQRILAN